MYWLEANGVQFQREKSFPNLVNRKTNRPLRYDFFIPDYDLLIEYDGEQHFQPISFTNESVQETEKKYIECKVRDEMKNNYAKNNGYQLLRIPYNKFDNIENILRNHINIDRQDKFYTL